MVFIFASEPPQVVLEKQQLIYNTIPAIHPAISNGIL